MTIRSGIYSYRTLAVLAIVLATALVFALIASAFPHVPAYSDLTHLMIAPVGALPAATQATIEALQTRAETLTRSIADGMDLDQVQRIESEQRFVLHVVDEVRSHNLDIPDAGTMPITQLRSAFLQALVSAEVRTDSRVGIDLATGADFSQMGHRVSAMGEALYARINPAHAASPAAQPYLGLRISDLAQICLRNANLQHTMMSPAELVDRALHTTSDFSDALGDTVNRVLQRAYSAPPSGIKLVARRTTAHDFRAKHAISFSEAPVLEKTNEAGEFKDGTFVDGKESYSVKTFGKIFGITRQALVNDNLGVFETVPARLARSARSFEDSFLANLLQSNPVLSDGKPVFHGDHGNLAAGSTLSEAALTAARIAMRSQVGMQGGGLDNLISVTPRYLVVPSQLETEAEKLVASITPATSSDVNVFAKRLEVVVEPRLADPKAWYVAASLSEIDGLEYAYLEGFEGPQIDTNKGFRVDGVEIRVRLDFGGGWVERRGWYKNPGQP